MASFRVVAGNRPARFFESPRAVLRADDLAQAREALRAAEAALDDGQWIAGYLAYELGAALADMSVRAGLQPLLALGVFDPPREGVLPRDDAAATYAPLLRTVSDATYDRTVATLQRAICDGDVYQVNYTVPFAFATQGDPFALYARLAQKTLAPYQAFVRDGTRAILSWSPELFLGFDGRRIFTKPMKGTAPLDRIAELENDKNRAEHLMIVDLLRNDLHRICDEVAVERLFELERYPTFATLTSTISGTRRSDVTLLDTFRATFPCGSVTGAPKRAAMQSIAACEPQPRAVYCGAIGFLSPQRRGWWNVAIRTAQIDLASGCGRFDVGGGIVADSSAAEERAEIGVKAAFLRAGGDPFGILETLASDADPATVAAHCARLRRSAERFGIPLDEAALERLLVEAAQAPRHLVRLRLALDGALARLVASHDAPPEPVRLCLAHAGVRSDDPYLAHKTTWRPAHDRARRRAEAAGCFDALLHNERGELTEGWRTNLFVQIDGELRTPPRECGLLPGILRARLVSEGTAERPVRPDDLRCADAVYVGNSARGLLRATLIHEDLP